MKLPPLKLPCHNETPVPQYATDLGFSVRVIDGSVWRAKPLQKLCHHEAAAEWLIAHCIDKVRAEFAAAACRLGRPVEGYNHNTAIAEARNRQRGKRV